MGYSTEFFGKLTLNKEATNDVIEQIKKYNNYHSEGNHTADHPDSYCQWEITADRKHLKWDGNEKFYWYVEWLEYLIENVFKPEGITVNGTLDAVGEDSENDISKIIVKNNKVTHKQFNQQEVNKYLEKQSQEYAKKAGKILYQTDFVSWGLTNYSYFNLKKLWKARKAPKKYDQTVVLVKEESGEANIYQYYKEEIKGKSIESLIGSSHAYNHFSAICEIKEIKQFDSPLFRTLLKTKNIFVIAPLEWLKRKKLFLFKDKRFIEILNEQIERETGKKLSITHSHDIHLMYSIIKKAILGGIILLMIGGYINSIVDQIINPKIETKEFIIMLIVIGVIYYFLIKKLLLPLFYNVFPKTIFRTKYGTNEIYEKD